MPVGTVPATIDHGALFVQLRRLGEIVGVCMEVGDVLSDPDSLGVVPRPLTDTVTDVDRALAAGSPGAEVGAATACSIASPSSERALL